MKRMHTDEEIQKLAASPIGDVSIDGDLAVDGDFEANSVSADSIIENMSGYAYTKSGDGASYTFTPIYVGAAKTGNKITFVAFFKFKRTASYSGGINIGRIDVPADVRAKLYPFTVGGLEYLDVKTTCAINSSDITDIKTVTPFSTKNDGLGGIFVSLRDWGSLTQDKDYMIRYEVTFLLSDNLYNA